MRLPPLALLLLAPLSAISQLSLPLYRRSNRDHVYFINARLRLLSKYGELPSALGNSLQKRQIAVPIIGTLPSSNSSTLSPTNNSNGRLSNSSNSSFNYSTMLRGVNDGRGGVVGLQRTFNFQADLEYFTSIQIGNPPQSLNVILDTGSADFWVASSNCTPTSGCSTNLGPKFDPVNSSTSNTPFSIKYGSGSATGKMFKDNMTFAGYNITNQNFAVVDTVSSELLSKDVSGLMGLGFQPLAASGVEPIWQSLLSNASQYNLSFPGFSFALTRYINVTGPIREVEPGGLFTLGTLNASLIEGEIEFVPLPKGLESYWLIPMGALAVGGILVDLGDEVTRNVAIDSGTTLLGGPAEQVKAFYSHVPGSVAASGSYQGYYSYPCNVTVDVSLQFGTRNYSMAPQDFNLGPFGTNGMCLGAVFELALTGASKQLISWVIGDSFLKNVVSVYRYIPPAVGFAKLSIPPFNTTGPTQINQNGTLFNPSTLNASEFNITTSKATAALPSQLVPQQISNYGGSVSGEGKSSDATTICLLLVQSKVVLIWFLVVFVNLFW